MERSPVRRKPACRHPIPRRSGGSAWIDAVRVRATCRTAALAESAVQPLARVHLSRVGGRLPLALRPVDYLPAKKTRVAIVASLALLTQLLRRLRPLLHLILLLCRRTIRCRIGGVCRRRARLIMAESHKPRGGAPLALARSPPTFHQEEAKAFLLRGRGRRCHRHPFVKHHYQALQLQARACGACSRP